MSAKIEGPAGKNFYKEELAIQDFSHANNSADAEISSIASSQFSAIQIPDDDSAVSSSSNSPRVISPRSNRESPVQVIEHPDVKALRLKLEYLESRIDSLKIVRKKSTLSKILEVGTVAAGVVTVALQAFSIYQISSKVADCKGDPDCVEPEVNMGLQAVSMVVGMTLFAVNQCLHKTRVKLSDNMDQV